MVIISNEPSRFCPFRKKRKKDICLQCFTDCALYIGKYPNGKCAFRVLAENTLPRSSVEEKKL